MRRWWTLLAVAAAGACSAPGSESPHRGAGERRGPTVWVSLADRYQHIVGWEATAEIGVTECDTAAVRALYPEIIRRSVEELGLNRMRLEIRPGQERPASWGEWSAYRRGELPQGMWRRLRTAGVNDNADPFVRVHAAFQWGLPDLLIDTLIKPLQRALEARGERLYVNVTFVDFYVDTGPQQLQLLTSPEEYAELVVAAFEHFRDVKGLVPDALELLNEPENTPYTAEEIGRALVAVERRLRAAGFSPDFIVGSTMRAVNAVRYYDAIRAVPGAADLAREIAYHRYGGNSAATRRMVARRAERDSVRTSMLEHIGADFQELYEDLTQGQVSAWQRFGLAYCMVDPNVRDGVYYVLDTSQPGQPRLELTPATRLLRQVFAYVRRDAQRIGARTDGTHQAMAFINRDSSVVTVIRLPAAGTVHVLGLPSGTYRANYSTEGAAYNVELPPVATDARGTVTVSVPEPGVVTVYR